MNLESVGALKKPEKPTLESLQQELSETREALKVLNGGIEIAGGATPEDNTQRSNLEAKIQRIQAQLATLIPATETKPQEIVSININKTPRNYNNSELSPGVRIADTQTLAELDAVLRSLEEIQIGTKRYATRDLIYLIHQIYQQNNKARLKDIPDFCGLPEKVKELLDQSQKEKLAESFRRKK